MNPKFALIFETEEEMEKALKKINNPTLGKDQQKLPPKKQVQELPKCEVCQKPLENPTHTLCLEHFKEKMQRQREIEEA